MGALGGLGPVTDLASKALKADKVKKVSLKVKLKVKKGDAAVKQDGTRPMQSSGT